MMELHTQTEENLSWFELNPVKTIVFSIFFIITAILLLAEFALRYFGGYGNPVLYDSSPIYGYRLLPDQEVSRFRGAKIRVNNLGLRADEDWNNEIENKILFVGNSVTYGGSYISNNELFSYLAVKDIPGFQSGNAGVNGWGVENMHGLVVESHFLPAKLYVTVLENGLRANYILDRINALNLGVQDKEVLFHGEVHLEKEGHALWGSIINADVIGLMARHSQTSAAN